MATEEILLAGGDRQEMHEKIRQHSQEAARQVKMLGQPNDLLDRLENEPAFSQVRLRQVLDPQRFIGRAPEQVEQFIEAVVNPIRKRYGEALKQSITLRV